MGQTDRKERKRRWKKRARLITLAALTGGVALLCAQLPADTWIDIGQKAALASAALQQAGLSGTDTPSASLSGQSERQTAAAPGQSGEPLPSTGATADETAAAAPTAETPAAAIPAEDGSGGRVVEQQVTGGTEAAGLTVKNKSGVSPDLSAALAAALPYTIAFNSEEPQVLIYHTHATEAYMPYDAGYYNDGDTLREPSNANNVRAVGDALAEELTAAGVCVLHDTTLHDYPAYRGAYDRSADTVQRLLEENPSIQVILDIHRDGLMLNETDKLKPTVTIDGQKTAQLMVVCGVVSTDALPHPHWQQNLAFAAQLQQTLDGMYDGLTRPLSLVSARYNQNLSPGALLIEVGSEGNTLEEAVAGARLLGRGLVSLWQENAS